MLYTKTSQTCTISLILNPQGEKTTLTRTLVNKRGGRFTSHLTTTLSKSQLHESLNAWTKGHSLQGCPYALWLICGIK